ncbi:hypothetical protein BU15DRAFT_67259 [Melanogaster broomeanus]|nr:hypothetical protein BU15DRAFT_67259 [Melanogaster broomeanus]
MTLINQDGSGSGNDWRQHDGGKKKPIKIMPAELIDSDNSRLLGNPPNRPLNIALMALFPSACEAAFSLCRLAPRKPEKTSFSLCPSKPSPNHGRGASSGALEYVDGFHGFTDIKLCACLLVKQLKELRKLVALLDGQHELALQVQFVPHCSTIVVTLISSMLGGECIVLGTLTGSLRVTTPTQRALRGVAQAGEWAIMGANLKVGYEFQDSDPPAFGKLNWTTGTVPMYGVFNPFSRDASVVVPHTDPVGDQTCLGDLDEKKKRKMEAGL